MNELNMARVVTIAEMQNIDANSINGDYSIGFEYMKKAGQALCAKVLEVIADNGLVGTVEIFCGKGNNGGDGYVLAKLLHDRDIPVRCYGVVTGDKLLGEVSQAYANCLEVGVEIKKLSSDEVIESFADTCLIVDALLGTGMNGNPRTPIDQVIEYINNSGILIVAVDTPSGVNNEKGIPGEPCIEADYTVSMGFAKLGSLFYPLREYYGELTIADLEYPEITVEEESVPRFVIDDQILHFMPVRTPWGDKVDHGITLMLAGSKGMLGAPALAAQAAMRTGCGMVHLATPQCAVDILSQKLVEPVIHGVPATESGAVSMKALSDMRGFAEKADVLCLGPGLSSNSESAQLVKSLIKTVSCPIVVDADGLNALSDCPEVLQEARTDIVLTPHAGEYTRLFGKLPNVIEGKVASIHRTAKKYGVTIVYKGYPTIVATPQEVYINPYGNSGMATAGSGDVLSGIVSSLIAQGCSAQEAAILGTYIHTTAGDVAADELSEYSMLASDIVNSISVVMQNIVGYYD